MKMAVVLVVETCSLVKVYLRFKILPPYILRALKIESERTIKTSVNI